MVILTKMLLKKHGSGRGHQNWIESLRIYCKAGRGGNGLPTVGGVGGRGGDVIIECSVKPFRNNEDPFKSLNDVFKKVFHGDSTKQRLLAGVGANARLQRIIGEPGTHAVLEVPPGVLITDDSSGRILKDLNKPGDKVVAAIGGQGGGPSNDWIGVKGQQRFIRLDLKLLADVGLVGFPNAGKSTLLKAISKANPKIASYPFTTIKPNLGHLVYEDGREITMADLPGLIEGASYNVGMGHRFLKHVERTRLLLFVVDVSGFQLNMNSSFRNAFETVTLLNRELELYNPDLLGKPAVCLVNKMDTDNDEKNFKDFLKRLNDRTNEEYLQNLSEECRPTKAIEFKDVIPISAKCNRISVDYVKKTLRTVIDETEEAKLNLNLNVKKFEAAFEKATTEANPQIY